MSKRLAAFVPPVLLLLLVASYTLSSCKKKNCPAEGIVTVLDKNGKPIAGATVTLDTGAGVTLTGPIASYLPDKKTTDANGKTYHSFPHEALLFIYVVKPPDTARQVGYLKLERCETAEKTVTY